MFLISDGEEVSPAEEEVIDLLIVSGAEGVTKGPVCEPAENDVCRVLHHYIHLVLHSDRAALKEAKTYKGKREAIMIYIIIITMTEPLSRRPEPTIEKK